MILFTSIYRRVKRDGRNPSTGAKTLEVPIKVSEIKLKKMKAIIKSE